MSRDRKYLLASAALCLLAFGATDVDAASKGFVRGGFFEKGVVALKSHFARETSGTGSTTIDISDKSTTPVVGFTPRFAGVPIDLADGASVDRGSLLKATVGGTIPSETRTLSLTQTHDLGLFELDVSALAGYAENRPHDLGQSSTLVFGGGLTFDSLGGLRFDAAYTRRDQILGLARDDVSAAVGYDFAGIDTRLSVANVAQYDSKGVATDELQIWSLGGQMQLGQRFVVGGDLAYSTSLDGAEDTSGVVNFRFNF